MILAQPRQLAFHARFQLALEQVRNVRAERFVSRAEKSRARTVTRQGPTLHEVYKRRCIAAGTEQTIYDATQSGPTTDTGKFLDVITALALEPIVPAGRADEGAEENKSIRHCRHARHQLGEMHAGKLGSDAGEFTAQFGGGFRLGIDHVHLRRAAVEMDVDHRLGRGAVAVFRAQQIGQGKTAHAQRARAQKTPACLPVTMTGGLSKKLQHSSG